MGLFKGEIWKERGAGLMGDLMVRHGVSEKLRGRWREMIGVNSLLFFYLDDSDCII